MKNHDITPTVTVNTLTVTVDTSTFFSGLSTATTIYNTNTLEFSYYDYRFKLTDINRDTEVGGGWFTLNGDGWSEPLETLYFLDDKTDHQLIEQALRWICKYV